VATRASAPDNDVGVRMAGVVVIDSDPGGSATALAPRMAPSSLPWSRPTCRGTTPRRRPTSKRHDARDPQLYPQLVRGLRCTMISTRTCRCSHRWWQADRGWVRAEAAGPAGIHARASSV